MQFLGANRTVGKIVVSPFRDPAQEDGLLGQGESTSKRVQDLFQIEKLRGSEPISQTMCHQSPEVPVDYLKI